jgi:CBS domain-containing protein
MTSVEHVHLTDTDTIADIKNTDVVGIEKDSSLYDVINNLVVNKISKNFVFDKNKPVGIITDKDIIRFLFIDKSGRSFHQISAQEMMNNICFTVESMTCQQAAQMMIINDISMLGIGSKKKLDGIITKTDLLRYYVNRNHDDSKVSDYMTVSYFSASVDDKVHEIIKKMVTCDISRLVILDNDQKPAGIITNGDIFRITMDTDKMSIVQSSLSSYMDQDGLWSETGFVGSQVAGEIMTEGIISADFNTSMMSVAKTILDKKIDSLGINNNDGYLIGLINKTNILYALANPGGSQIV